MNFKNQDIIIDHWNIKYIDDPYAIFQNIAAQLFNDKPKKHTPSIQTSSKQQLLTRAYPSITESYTWPIFNPKTSEVELFSGFNAFYGVGSKLSKDKRKETITAFIKNLEGLSNQTDRKNLHQLLDDFFSPAHSHKERLTKVGIRKQCIELIKNEGTTKDLANLNKLVFRPIKEMYIPIPDSKNFHIQHPNFFGTGYGQFESKNPNKLLLTKDKLIFDLTFEPSGQTLKAYISQDNGKAIMSKDSQQILGDWILKGVFNYLITNL